MSVLVSFASWLSRASRQGASVLDLRMLNNIVVIWGKRLYWVTWDCIVTTPASSICSTCGERMSSSMFLQWNFLSDHGEQVTIFENYDQNLRTCKPVETEIGISPCVGHTLESGLRQAKSADSTGSVGLYRPGMDLPPWLVISIVSFGIVEAWIAAKHRMFSKGNSIIGLHKYRNWHQVAVSMACFVIIPGLNFFAENEHLTAYGAMIDLNQEMLHLPLRAARAIWTVDCQVCDHEGIWTCGRPVS